MPLKYLDAESIFRIQILEFILIFFNFKNFQAHSIFINNLSARKSMDIRINIFVYYNLSLSVKSIYLRKFVYISQFKGTNNNMFTYFNWQQTKL